MTKRLALIVGYRAGADPQGRPMSEPGHRSEVRRERVLLRIRRVAQNRYQITDMNGQGVEFRKRHDFARELRAVIDAAGGQEIILEGRLNRFGRWSIAGPKP